MTILKRYWVLIALLALNIFTHKVWIFNTDFLTYGDARVYVQDTQLQLANDSTQIYSASNTLGNIELSGGTKLIELVHGLLAKVGVFYPISFRIIYLYPFVFLAPIIAYYFFKKFIKSEVGIFCAAVVYLFNTYTLILQSAGVLMLLADMFILLLLLFYYKFFYEKKSITNFAMASFSGFLISTYDFRVFYIACIITSIFVVHYFFFIKKDIRVFFWHCALIAMVILLNMHWILALLTLGKLSTNELFSRGLFGSSYFDVVSALLLFHRFWTFAKPAAFVNQLIPIHFWLIPVFVFGGISYAKKDKLSIFFMLISILGVFLTKQEDIPFTQIYNWLYNNVPGFNAFREASKFYILTVIGYSGLVGYFAQGVSQDKKISKLPRLIIYIAVTATFMLNTIPLITGTFATLFTPRTQPEDYKTLNNFLKEDGDTFRTLWVPINSKWGVYTNAKPAISAVEIENNISGFEKTPSYVNYIRPDNSVVNILRQSYTPDILNRYAIKYIIIPLRDTANEDDFFKDYGNNRQHYIDITNSLTFLEKLNINTQDVIVYRNNNYKPRIYMTSTLEKVDKQVDLIQVEYEQIQPTQYKLKLKNISNTMYINFSENYSTGWQMYTMPINWWNIATKRTLPISNISNIKNDIGLNTFVIEPNIIKTTLSPDQYVVNKDGSMDIDLILYYKPQSVYQLGLLISTSVAIILFSATLVKIKRTYD